MKNTVHRISSLGMLLCLLIAIGTGAFAQVSTTAIHGVVRDPSGALVPNAVLRLKDPSTGIEKASTSNEDGVFAFPSLQSGSYDLSAAAPGFQSSLVRHVVVDTGRVTDITVEMKVGGTAETVEVTATSVQLETSSNLVSTTISNNLNDNMPFPRSRS